MTTNHYFSLKNNPQVKMKLSIFLPVFAAIAFGAAAKVQPVSMLALQKSASASRAEASPYIPVLMLLDSESGSKADLEKLGVIFYHQRGDIFLTSVPRGAVSDVLSVDGIIDISCANTTSLCADLAREFSFVEAVHAGLPELSGVKYTGNGVVTGISDIGFDPHHVAFRGNLRSVADFHPEKNAGTILAPDALDSWTSDNNTKTHATHVGNIMAGSYTEGVYYGAAPESDFVATTSSLNDVGILLGVEHIVQYAENAGKRAVINLSLSTPIGPHDGSALMSQYLDFVAEQTGAIICVSSGNDGWTKGHAFFDFSSDASTAAFLSHNGNNISFDNYIDIWSSDNKPFQIRCDVIDADTNLRVYSSDWYTSDSDEKLEVTPPQFDGSISFQGYLCPMDNRYNVAASLNYTTEERADDGRNARYICAFTVRADPGVRIDALADLNPMVLAEYTGDGNAFAVTSDGTVNDMASARNVIAVGSCASRNQAPVLPDGSYSWAFTVGSVSDWSSYATATPFCRALPDICAPGQQLVSAMSTDYYNQLSNPWINAETIVGDKHYYWFADQGTSMSSPLAAGIIALWLEANPALTVQEIKSIAAKTARTDLVGYPSAQWGPGCINAAAGIQEALNISSSVTDIDADHKSDSVSAIYTLTGIRLPHTDTSRLAPGTYITVTPSGSHKIRL